MKKILFILFLFSIIQACSQQKSKEVKAEYGTVTFDEVGFSGEYSGSFKDLKNDGGTIELFLYQSNNGFSEGIIILKKKDGKLVTGVAQVTGNGKFLNGNFTPSIIKNSVLRSEKVKNLDSISSYQCGWRFYGEIKDETGNMISGKAVPMNCSESNLMEFILKRNK